MKANYHTHTTRCHHANGLDEDYVKSAIQAGFQILGFSDHSPWKYNSNFVSHMRMELHMFQDYKKSILSLKEKYKDQIDIKLGLECEYFEEYMPWLKEFIIEEELDYIIFGNHYNTSDENRKYFGTLCYNKEGLLKYKEKCIKGMETGLYSYLCHPELFMRSYPKFDDYCKGISEEICLAAKHYQIPLEYNLTGLLYNHKYGVENYPHHKFWEIAKDTKNECIIGVDAHDPRQLEDHDMWENAQQYLKQLGIVVLDKLEMKNFKAIMK